MRLTAFDPEASVYRREPREVVVLVRDDGTELLLQSESPNALPPMDVPQPTEPFSDGTSWQQAAPKRPPERAMFQEKIESPWLVRLYGWAFVAAIVVSALLARCPS